ncbi:hypothetical protein [Haloarchaeobius sp. DT45]|uniref:hypothetical protein n=1 Tax=Haloarchaeobius sp. DT45 TaxID=3446116 RepID=UPI003F6BF2D4
MKSGSLAIIQDQGKELETYRRNLTRDGFEVEDFLEVRQKYTDLNGDILGISGRAALQIPEETESVEIDDGSISVAKVPEIGWVYTDILYVPDEFVIIGSGVKNPVISLIEEAMDGHVEKAEIDLRKHSEYLQDEVGKENVNPWKIGFYGKSGNANNGVVHGDQLLEDSDLGSILQQTIPNQLGFSFPRDGRKMKTFVTESGYVEVYQPDNFDTAEYLQFIRSDILEFTN